MPPTSTAQTPAPRGRRQWLLSLLFLTFLGPLTIVFAGQQPQKPLPVAPPGVLPDGAGELNLAPDAPVCPPANAGLPDRLTPVPLRPARPLDGPGSVKGFTDGVTQNDAGFEVLVGQGRILTTRVDLAAKGKAPALVAIGDPTVADFAVVSARQLRVEGRRIGVTDISIVTPEGETYSFEVRVVADLHVLRGQLHCMFPGTSLRLTQVRDHVVVEGEARDTAQVARILEVIEAYLVSVQTGQMRQVTSQLRPQNPAGGVPGPGGMPPVPNPDQPGAATPEVSPGRVTQAAIAPPRVVNLIRVPGSKQVLLRVRVAELNRTAFRQIGADFLATPGSTVFGTQIGGAGVTAAASRTGRALTGLAQTVSGTSTTAFGIFEQGDFAFLMSALRRNNMLRILAEPNLVAMHGQAANFLAGGEFPVPVPQTGGGGIAPTITVQFKEFGVRLGFLPFILDGEMIRLAVDPEVSTIDPTLGTILVPGGTPVPGLNTRRAHTVVEMREGQTLAMAGLLQVTLDGSTQRIPGLGDLPILGPFFSNTTSQRIEKELIVLVTPYLVDPANCDQLPPTPGDEVKTPDDFEFYFLNRIEGRKCDWRATTDYDKQMPVVRSLLRLDAAHVRGPYGFCD